MLEVIGRPVQSVPLERFTALGPNDVLFIDSTHVLKTGSDVAYLFGQVLPVLPVLAPGVVVHVHVHVHDIFWPFEYLPQWIREGRAWNEAYLPPPGLLETFLSGSRDYEGVLWNHYLAQRHRDVVAEELPGMVDNPGGAIWLRRCEAR